jgi:aryl sulfotransferase
MTIYQWPRKQGELLGRHMDSSIWNDFRFRDDDIVVATYGKTGTTWTQQIVLQLVFDGQEGLDIMQIAPWLDFRAAPREEMLAALEAQTHRRSIKTHLPVHALVYSPRAKYIYVARDGRDVGWSMYNHVMHMGDEILARLNALTDASEPILERPSVPVDEYVRGWINNDGYPFWSFWDHVRGWWAIRDLPNLLLVHYADLKADLAGEMRRIATFLEIEIPEARWPVLVEHCTFDYMKRTAPDTLGLVEQHFVGGARSFIHKGTNGRWRDMLTAADCEHYEALARKELGPACADWLAHGRRGSSIPGSKWQSGSAMLHPAQ